LWSTTLDPKVDRAFSREADTGGNETRRKQKLFLSRSRRGQMVVFPFSAL